VSAMSGPLIPRQKGRFKLIVRKEGRVNDNSEKGERFDTIQSLIAPRWLHPPRCEDVRPPAKKGKFATHGGGGDAGSGSGNK